VIVADGTSCRVQIKHGTGRQAQHVALPLDGLLLDALLLDALVLDALLPSGATP